jgi:hypothetical protein
MGSVFYGSKTMKCIAKNSLLIQELKDKNALLDAKIMSIHCFSKASSLVMLQLDLEPRKGSYKGNIRLEFYDVKEFSFYYDHADVFYYLERYKLFLTSDNDYYCSIDPYNEIDEPSKEDRGIIRAKKISGLFL